MRILHGEHLTHSRERLVTFIDAAKAQGTEIYRYPAPEVNEASLEQLLGESNLFGTARLIVIEELHSQPQSKKRDGLIERLTTTSDPSTEIILWEKRTLTKPMLKKFPEAEVEEFKMSNVMFTWLDSISADKKALKRQLTLLQEVIAAEDAFYCLIMLMRQMRLLIQVKDGGSVGGAPFMVAKLQKQAQSFTLPQLLKAHHRLLELDLAHKTSTNRLSLSQDLDLFILHL